MNRPFRRAMPAAGTAAWQADRAAAQQKGRGTFRSAMLHFRVIFSDVDPAAFGSLSFQAGSVNEALSVIADYYATRPVELWCEGSFLGRIERIVEETGSFWRVG